MVFRFISRPLKTITRHFKTLSDIPGPRDLPIIGSDIFLRWDKENVLKGIIPLRSEYGDLVRVRLPMGPYYVLVFDPEMSEIVYRKSGSMPVRIGFDCLKRYRNEDQMYETGKGLLMTQGEEWKEFRSYFQQILLRPQNTLVYAERIEAVADDFLNGIVEGNVDPDTRQTPEDFLQYLYRWSLESVAVLSLNYRLNVIDPRPGKVEGELIRTVNRFLELSNLLDYSGGWRKFLPYDPMFQEFIRMNKTLETIISQYIRMTMENIKKQKDLPDENPGDPSMLEIFYRRNYDEVKILVFALEAFIAGIDTTSHTMSFALYYLAQNPDIQDKVYREVSQYKVDKEFLQKVPYLRAVLKETLRMRPIAFANIRTLSEDVELRNYKIPAGTALILEHYSMCHDPRFVIDPERFIPERFIKNQYQPLHPFVSLPFGHGPRMCIGKRFAELEMAILLAKFVMKYKIEWHHPELEFKNHLLLYPFGPLKYTLTPR